MTSLRPRRPRPIRAAVVAVVAALGVLSTGGCTPAEFQAWWTSQGNPPLSEPELSRRAADATRYWAEIARQERFDWTVSPITGALANRMTPSSWRAGCPVPLSSLRYVRVSHMDLQGRERVGELVLHHDAVNRVVAAFKLMWDARFGIERMQLVDDFGGSDAASMAANNTSAFNCRRVSGTSTWSQHAYGRAIDINPVQNPYVSGGLVDPPAGNAYLNRGDVRPGMLVQGGPAVSAFDRIGWGWGGRWSSSKDYQHVSANGR